MTRRWGREGEGGGGTIGKCAAARAVTWVSSDVQQVIEEHQGRSRAGHFRPSFLQMPYRLTTKDMPTGAYPATDGGRGGGGGAWAVPCHGAAT